MSAAFASAELTPGVTVEVSFEAPPPQEPHMVSAETLSVAATLFFVMDPLGNIPLFNAILAGFEPRRRALIVARELVFALVVLLGFLFAGNTVMAFLGLSRPTLSLSGGILLFVISLRMIFPPPVAAGGDGERPQPEDPFIVPLAVPMIAGPSTLAVLLLLASSRPERMWSWAAALVLAWIGAVVILVCSPWLMRVLGDRGVRALERLMGMLLVMMAVQMFLNGVTAFYKSLAG